MLGDVLAHDGVRHAAIVFAQIFLRGTGERLTQPGYLAIIYTQDKEYDEYRRYVEYLAGKGLLETEYETLELDDLQGVSGLRALRAKIVLS